LKQTPQRHKVERENPQWVKREQKGEGGSEASSQTDEEKKSGLFSFKKKKNAGKTGTTKAIKPFSFIQKRGRHEFTKKKRKHERRWLQTKKRP